MKAFAVGCLAAVSAGAWVAAAQQPKLVGETVMMKADAGTYGVSGGRPWWAVRLSPDGEHLLFARLAPGKAAGPPAPPRRGYQVVLRHWRSGKETVVPIPLLTDVGDVLITAIAMNPFSADGRLLVVPAGIDADGDGIWTERQEKLQPAIYDIASGKLRRIDATGEAMVATFDATGKRLLFAAVETMRPLKGKIYVTPPDKTELKALKPFGLPRTPSPVASAMALGVVHPVPQGRPLLEFVVYDFAKDSQMAELPISDRGMRALDDYTPQWTADGRFLYYLDVEMEPGAQPGPPKRFTRVWDTRESKEAARLADFAAVGPRGGSTMMVLAMVLARREGGAFLHDAKTGTAAALAADPSLRPISTTGRYLVYVRKNAQGDQLVCRGEIKTADR